MSTLALPLPMTFERELPDSFGPDHEPVLVAKLLEAVSASFAVEPVGLFVDGTVGAGGHASVLLERFGGLRLLGLDQDEDSLALAADRLERFEDRARLDRARLSELDAVLDGESEPLRLALIDVGVCSIHLDRADRGFSFLSDGPLDMRMDRRLESTAADIVANYDETRLADLIYHEGGERRSRPIAKAICDARRRVPFLRTRALADLIERTVGGGGAIHPATKTFQALRREVNREGAELEAALAAFERHLAPGGVAAVITFHSGEDGVVKRFFANAKRAGTFELASSKPIGPERDEIRRNPRARSARLRLASRTDRPVGEGQA